MKIKFTAYNTMYCGDRLPCIEKEAFCVPRKGDTVFIDLSPIKEQMRSYDLDNEYFREIIVGYAEFCYGNYQDLKEASIDDREDIIREMYKNFDDEDVLGFERAITVKEVSYYFEGDHSYCVVALDIDELV